MAHLDAVEPVPTEPLAAVHAEAPDAPVVVTPAEPVPAVPMVPAAAVPAPPVAAPAAAPAPEPVPPAAPAAPATPAAPAAPAAAPQPSAPQAPKVQSTKDSGSTGKPQQGERRPSGTSLLSLPSFYLTYHAFLASGPNGLANPHGRHDAHSRVFAIFRHPLVVNVTRGKRMGWSGYPCRPALEAGLGQQEGRGGLRGLGALKVHACW